MKLPENWKQKLNSESSHRTNHLNTLTLSGISLLWGHMLSLVSWWWLPLTVLLLLAGYGNEIVRRKGDFISG